MSNNKKKAIKNKSKFLQFESADQYFYTGTIPLHSTWFKKKKWNNSVFFVAIRLYLKLYLSWYYLHFAGDK